MPNVQEVLRQNEFNNLVSTEIIDAYINRLTGKRAVDINTIEELDSLNFFPMSYIASLNDDNKEKLLNVFKEAASSKDYRKFIQVVEARVPGINNRTNNGFAREYENFADLGNAYNLSPANKSKSKIDIAAGLFGDSYGSMLFIPLNENQNEALIAGGIGYIDKPDSDIVKARQDAAIAGGAYDPNIGSFHRTLNGTTASDLD